MKKLTSSALACLLVVTVAQAEVRVGAGAHYWTALEDIDADDVAEEGLSYLATMQFFAPSPLKLPWRK